MRSSVERWNRYAAMPRASRSTKGSPATIAKEPLEASWWMQQQSLRVTSPESHSRRIPGQAVSSIWSDKLMIGDRT